MDTDARTRAVLTAHSLPAGLLPAGSIQADIRDDGRFSVRYSSPCEREHGGFRVRFARTIEGRLTAGTVTQLVGVSVRLGLGLSVQRITRRGDGLDFVVGPITHHLPLSEFSS